MKKKPTKANRKQKYDESVMFATRTDAKKLKKFDRAVRKRKQTRSGAINQFMEETIRDIS